MISFFISLVLGVLVLVCLGLKMTGRRFSKTMDIALCVIIPVICVLVFIAIVVESSVRRKANAIELNQLLSVVEISLNSDRVFTSNAEKKGCIDSLHIFSEFVNTIAFNDSLITLIAGRDTCMQRRIAQTNNAIGQSEKWLSRLNDLYIEDVLFSKKEYNDTALKLIGPGSDNTSVVNIAFKVIESEANIICSYVQVTCSDMVLFNQAFEYNPEINCFNIPFTNKNGEMIELGYVYQDNDNMKFKYITYGKKYTRRSATY